MCECFFVQMYITYVYIFFSLLYDITRVCAQVLYFFDFLLSSYVHLKFGQPTAKPR